MTNVDHASFVTTKTGCYQRDVFYIFSIAYIGLFIRNLALPWIFLGRKYDSSNISYWLKFVADVFFLILPSFLALTIMANHLVFFLMIMISVAILLNFLVIFEYYDNSFGSPIKKTWVRILDESYKPTTFVTYLRSSTMIAVTIAILAVDFPVFPRKFSKTETFGHSPMDVGVAAFLYIAGIGKQMAGYVGIKKSDRKKHKWRQSSTLILFIVGLLRVVFLEILGYPKVVTEYGVHWNFFFTMAAVMTIYRLLPKQFPLLFCVVFGVCHQTILKSGYQKWIVTEGENDRTNIFSANAEGIVSLFGYLTIFYGSLTIGQILSKTSMIMKSWLKRCIQLLIWSLIFLLCQFICEKYVDLSSRRVVNVTYIFSQLFLMTFATAMCLLVQMYNIFLWSAGVPSFSNGDDPFSSLSPCLFESINQHSLDYFLLSNLFTGLVNFMVNTHELDDYLAIIVLVVYLFATSIIVHLFHFFHFSLNRFLSIFISKRFSRAVKKD